VVVPLSKSVLASPRIRLWHKPEYRSSNQPALLLPVSFSVKAASMPPMLAVTVPSGDVDTTRPATIRDRASRETCC
jgi:hypothetical protein